MSKPSVSIRYHANPTMEEHAQSIINFTIDEILKSVYGKETPYDRYQSSGLCPIQQRQPA